MHKIGIDIIKYKSFCKTHQMIYRTIANGEQQNIGDRYPQRMQYIRALFTILRTSIYRNVRPK